MDSSDVERESNQRGSFAEALWLESSFCEERWAARAMLAFWASADAAHPHLPNFHSGNDLPPSDR